MPGYPNGGYAYTESGEIDAQFMARDDHPLLVLDRESSTWKPRGTPSRSGIKTGPSDSCSAPTAIISYSTPSQLQACVFRGFIRRGERGPCDGAEHPPKDQRVERVKGVPVDEPE